MKKAAIYCRQSVDKVDSISIETQTEFAARTLMPEEEYEVYSDKGYSGGNTDRPDFQRLMGDIRNGLIDKVVVYRIDRISRSLMDFTEIYRELDKNGVKFHSASENFDTSTPMGMATLQIIMVFAELERKTIQQRIKDNFYERAKKGMFLAGRAPIGFKKVPAVLQGCKTHILEEDIETSGVVKALYSKYLEKGMSIGGLVKYINSPECEIKSPKVFSNTAISRILANPVYVRANADVYTYFKTNGAIIHNDISEFDGIHGCTIYGNRKQKTISKFKDMTDEHIQLNEHEGYIDAEDWLKVQAKLDSNKSIKNNGKGKNSWLSGLIKCGYCGLAVTVVNGQRNGKRYVYCNGRKNKVCYKRKEHFTFDQLEKAVEEELLKHIRSYQFVDVTEKSTKANKSVNELKIRQIKLAEEISSIVDKFLAANETMQGYLNAKIEELQREKDAIDREILSSNADTTHPIKADTILPYINNWSSLDLDKKKDIASVFIDKITLTDDELHIDFLA